MSQFIYLNSGTLQSDGEPITGWTVAQRENLRSEIVLGQLPSFTQIPRAHSVVQPARPQSGPVGAHVDARGAVRVTLELTHQRLIVQIPHGNVPVRTTAEAYLKTKQKKKQKTTETSLIHLRLQYNDNRNDPQPPGAGVTRIGPILPCCRG